MLDSKIKRIIKVAKKKEPYRSLYKEIGHVKSISEIPFLEETNFSKFNSPASSKETGFCVYFTSGTTGNPKSIYHGLKEAEYISEYIKWICEVEGACKGERVAVLLGQSFWGAGYFTVHGHIKAKNSVIPIDTGLSKESIAKLINVFQPTVISSTPSFLMEIKKLLPKTKLKIIETTGEKLEIKTRKELEKHFHAEVFDAYGLTEGIIGTECKMHDGYHYHSQKLFLEIINPNTSALVNENKWGELVMTVLCDEAVTPIIRYKTGDICKISYKKCPCGLTFPRVWIKGRKNKIISLHEGGSIEFQKIKDVVCKLLGKDNFIRINVVKNKKETIIEVILKEINKDKIELAKKAVHNINYETIYLSKKGLFKVNFIQSDD